MGSVYFVSVLFIPQNLIRVISYS